MLLFTEYSYAKEYKLSSPDGKISVTVKAGPGFHWSASCSGKTIISAAEGGMILESGIFPGKAEMVKKAIYGKINQELIPEVPNKRSKITDNCNTLLVAFRSGISNQLRAGEKIKIKMVSGGGWVARISPAK